MKRLIPFWLLGYVIWIAGCAAARPQPNLTPTAAAPQATVTVRQPIPPTQVIPPTPTTAPTNTPPPTSTVTPSPTPTPTPTLPMPQGRLLFFWDPRSHLSTIEAAANLYMVSPDPETGQWHLQTILYHPYLWSGISLSPDEQWLAMEIQGDIELSFAPREGPPDEGRPILYALNLQNFSYHSWTHDYWDYFETIWLADNETIAYRNTLGLFTVSFTNATPQPLGDWVGNEKPAAFSLSPNGRFWAVGLYKQDLIFHDTLAKQTSVITGVPLLYDIYDMAWAPSSRWFAAGPNLLIANPQTLETIILSEGYVPAWSPDSQWLAFETSNQEGIHKRSNSLYMWNAGNREQQLIIDKYVEVLVPLWKPNTSDLAVGLRQEGVSSLSLISMPEGTIRSLYEVHEVIQMTPCTWSPDGEWLMFYMQDGERNESGVYIIHQSGRGLYPLVESDGEIFAPTGATRPPDGCFWLSQ